eukprot:14863448-Ditylum_brightwellii.AAC.1
MGGSLLPVKTQSMNVSSLPSSALDELSPFMSGDAKSAVIPLMMNYLQWLENYGKSASKHISRDTQRMW